MIGQGDGKYEPEVTNRNAMLIAAAPDLLAACINVLDTTRILHGYYTDTGVNDTELVKELRAAIAKAGVSL
jgi:flagellar biosynthesis regulator FlaF